MKEVKVKLNSINKEEIKCAKQINIAKLRNDYSTAVDIESNQLRKMY